MSDPDLQKLIDAKKAADQKRLEEAEKRTVANAKAAEINAKADVDWKDLTIIANEEAGRLSSVSSETGINIFGISAKNLAPQSVGYRLIRDKSALEIDIIFTRAVSQVHLQVKPTKAVPVLNHIRYNKQYSTIKSVDVREIIGEVASQLIKA